MSCQFCSILAGSIGAKIVLDDGHAVAFLDHRPLFPGHCLLVPRSHVETLSELPRDRVGALFERAQGLAAAVERAMAADGTFVAINNRVSQSVPHLHIHIVPRKKGDGLRGFFWPRHSYASEDEMIRVRDAIRAALAPLAYPPVDLNTNG